MERSAQEQGAQANRLARHLFTIATTAPPGKEVRVTGIGGRAHRGATRGLGALVRDRWRRPLGLGALACLAWALSGWRMSARLFSWRPDLGAPAAEVLLVLAAGARLSAYIGATVGEIGFLRGFWMDGSRRLAWLEDYAASVAASGDLPVPDASAPTASGSSTSRSPTPARLA